MTRSSSPAPGGDRIDFQIDGGPDLGVITGNVFSEETMYAVMQAAADHGWPVRPYQTMSVDQLVRAMLNAAGIDSRAGLSDTNLLGLVKATGYYTELAARLHAGDAPAVETSEYARLVETYHDALAGEGGMDPLPHTDNLGVLLMRQKAWSQKTFGPGARFAGVIAHIRKELLELEENPTDVTEWIDVVILALDGAWRAGHTPTTIVHELNAKYEKNRNRTWPDWRTAPADQPIEHVHDDDPGCRDCGRDNRNGTHSALESTGHLSHAFNPAPVEKVSPRGDGPVVKHGSDEAYEERAPFTDARRAFRDGWDSAIAELLNEVIRVQSVALAPSDQTSEDDINYYRNHALAHPLTTPGRSAIIQWLADKVAR